MKRQLAERFNQEVENHRKALLYYARNCDWETFEAKAGRLFDYVESIEFMELERRFFSVFNLILVFLILAIIGFLTVDFEVHRELFQFKNSFVMTALAVSSFELYFFIDYRLYVGVKTRYYKRRREKFIRNIEQDFKVFAAKQERALHNNDHCASGSGLRTSAPTAAEPVAS